VQQVGTPDEVYRRPANRFVATFVGSPAMNVLAAEVADGVLRAGPFSLAAPIAVPAGRPVDIGLRPEHVRLVVPDEGQPVEVEVVEDAGHERYLHLIAGGHRLVARAALAVHAAPGDVLHVAARSEDAHLFDAETGEALR
jgi:ABC-type sugar transport system ATPase subunit